MKKIEIIKIAVLVVIVIQLGMIIGKINSIYSDVDLATQQAVQIKDAIISLPTNFANSR